MACDAPVAGGGGGPPARAEALDRGRPAGGRDEARRVLTPDQAERAQEALQEGEQRPDPGGQEWHQSTAS